MSLLSSEMQRREVGWKTTDIYKKKHFVSIFISEKNQEISVKWVVHNAFNTSNPTESFFTPSTIY
jgi:hypothetical protein